MLAGDLSTMALADLLQWVDATRKRTLVEVEVTGGRTAWLVAEDRVVVAGSPPPKQGRLAADGTEGEPGPGRRAVTVERLLDLFLEPNGKFELRQTESVPDGAVPLELPVAFLLMEGMRLLDEWPRIRDTYPSDDARLGATDQPLEEGASLDAVDSAILELAQEAPALGEARLVLGLSRTALLRRVDRLRQRGLLDVEGTPHGPDVERSIVDQAQLLLDQQQYAEAAHVFRTLLASNPGDARVAALLAEAERLQIADCYRSMSPTDVVSIVEPLDRAALKGASLAVIDCLERPRSVAVLVLVSPLRELETLTALLRLVAKGQVRIESAD